MTFIKPEVDLDDPHQNEFIQDYLTAWADKHLKPGDKEWDPIEGAIELVQETYSPHAPDDAAHHNH